METVYHTTLNENKDSILTNGLQPTQKQLLEPTQIETYKEQYTLPSEETDPRGYAQQLALTILEQERPEQYPPHHKSIFFFPTDKSVGKLNRPIILEVETESFNPQYPIYQTPFDIATELFFETMQQFEILNQITQTTLHRLAQTYWKETETVNSKNDIKSEMEVFVHTTHISPEYISNVTDEY